MALSQVIRQWNRDRSEELSLRHKLCGFWDPALEKIPSLRLELQSLKPKSAYSTKSL